MRGPRSVLAAPTSPSGAHRPTLHDEEPPFVLPGTCSRAPRSGGQECPWLTVVNRRRRAGMARRSHSRRGRTWLRPGDGCPAQAMGEVRPRTTIQLVGWRAGTSRMCAQGASLWMKVKAADGFSVLPCVSRLPDSYRSTVQGSGAVPRSTVWGPATKVTSPFASKMTKPASWSTGPSPGTVVLNTTPASVSSPVVKS
jgi:hypothetical protein